MIHSWSIGDVRVTSVVEYVGPTHVPEATFPDFDAATFAAQKPLLPPGHWHESVGRFTIAIQLWVVHAGNDVVLVDAGVGNRKERPPARMHMLNTLLPQWLAAAGAAPAQVTHVLTTHLHSDHIGWNTTLTDGRWEPTFPKARYLVPRQDFDYFRELAAAGKAGDGSFADSMQPVVDAGLVDFIDRTSDLPAGLEPREAFGHTPGMMNYWLRSKGETGVFSADVFHHPVQILNPSWNTAFCIIPDAARATRAAFLAEAAQTGALIMPCHFPAPHTGYARKAGDGYRFEPAQPGFPGL
jgi:glyoxylase-like metal-dependent hydrolase (beta-lactamase superfamily II)